MEDTLTPILRVAIAFAKGRNGNEVYADDVLAACLLSVSRFGIASLGGLLIDMEALGIDWMNPPAAGEQPQPKVAYSDCTVALLDRAAAICRADHLTHVRIAHVMVAFASAKPEGLMAKLADQGIDSAAWRAAIVSFEASSAAPAGNAATSASYLSPEQAAEFLGVHHQTIRGYIRNGKLPALRIAGERAVRIRRENLERLLEPLAASEPE